MPISIHALLAESDRGEKSQADTTGAISIHALLAESDEPPRVVREPATDFYPRSPCGERHKLNINRPTETIVFLSTLSLRRATDAG